jgi:hypothetical protein
VVKLGSFTSGTYGLVREFLIKQTTTSGVLRNGSLTLFDETDAWSEPEQIGKHGWHTLLPSIELGALDSGESAGVGTLTTFSQPIEIVFPPVGLVDFGPFHISAGDVFFNSCLITAA